MSDIDRSVAPKPQKPRAFNFPHFERISLKNGLQILYAPHHKLPLVSLQLCVKAGADHDPAGLEGLAAITGHLLTDGTKSRDALAVSTALEELGTYLTGYADWNASFLELNCLRQNLESALDIFCDVLYNASIPDAEVERTRKQLLNQRLRVIDSAGRMASETFNGLLYGGQRYGKPLDGTQKEIAAFTRDTIAGFYEQAYTPSNATLIMVGDISRDETEKIARSYFHGWKKKSRISARDIGSFNHKSVHLYLVDKPGARQAEIRMGHIGIDRHQEDYFPTVMLNQVLGGYFLSRLNQNLREDKGFTYGINSRFVNRKGRGPFLIASAVDSQNVKVALQEILNEIRRLQQEPVAEEELQNALGYMSGVFPIAFESGLNIAAGLSNIVVHGLDDDYYRSYREKMAAVTREDILKAAQNNLHPDDILIVVCADRKEIEKQLDGTFDFTVTQSSK